MLIGVLLNVIPARTTQAVQIHGLTVSTPPIFKIAHYPIVGDLYEELPKLVSAIGGDRHAN